MTRDAPGVTKAHGAVMATRPARLPLSVMPRSGLPRRIQAVAVAVSVAIEAASAVVIATSEMTRASAAIVLPGLKPNQPNHRMKQPMVAAVRLFLPSALYLPMRGPRMMTPARAAQPPMECTWVEPAKSRKPID
jgi:hypothetical protein